MIHVWINRNAEDHIVEMTLDGHADYAESGSDIVCAAVSALSIGIVNSIEHFLGIELHSIDEAEQGFMWIRTPEGLDSARVEQFQLLLRTLAFSLQGIADQYPEYIEILDEISE